MVGVANGGGDGEGLGERESGWNERVCEREKETECEGGKTGLMGRLYVVFPLPFPFTRSHPAALDVSQVQLAS